MDKIDDVTQEQWESVNPKNKKMVEEYLKQSKQLSNQTLKQYTSALKIYFYWVKVECDDKNFWEIKSRNYLMYQNWLIDKELSSSAIKFKRSAVSSFNNYIELYYEDEYPLFRNYINKAIASPAKQFVHKKEPLTIKEFENLIEKLTEKGMWQQIAYLRFSFSTGARRAEVRQLLKEIVNYEPKTSIIKTKDEKGNDIEKKSISYYTHTLRCKGKGKTGKVRKLQLDDLAMNSIKTWLNKRGVDDCPFVFVTKRNGKYEQVGETTFNLWSDKYFEPIVGRRFHPHLLRESRATSIVVEQGKDIDIAKKLLGHESSETTQLYVIRENENNADEAFT